MADMDDDALRARLLALASAHNKAVLAGVVMALLAALGVGAAGLALGARLAGAAAPAVALGGLAGAAVLIWKGLRLHGRVVRDLGPARRAAAALARAVLARGGGPVPVAEVEAAIAQPELLRALDFLGRLGLAWAERGGAGDVLFVDAARLTG